MFKICNRGYRQNGSSFDFYSIKTFHGVAVQGLSFSMETYPTADAVGYLLPPLPWLNNLKQVLLGYIGLSPKRLIQSRCCRAPLANFVSCTTMAALLRTLPSPWTWGDAS